ncbi:MAG: Gfo/Idh/MocA family oxidoreductase [Chloroflexi bacterium]|nr:Gfo/Idh/MocA family oxidoreductase [Chloroflexota bacterium]
MVRRIRAAFVGAGNRAFSAHYPTVARLADEVDLAAVCEFDPARLARGADLFGLPQERRYSDLGHMLAEVRPELVYAIMGPTFVRPVAERCLAAGAHVVLEKPPGASVADVEALARAARSAGRQVIVCFQRRHAAVVQEARRRILARGPLTMCIVEFHKDLVPSGPSPDGMTTLWDDVVHIIDLARFLCGGRVEAVHAYRDRLFTDWPSCYNALVRFDNGATAMISGNRTSGGRFLRVEAHGREIGAYMDDLPRAVRILTDNSRVAEEITGAQLSGSEDLPTYEGVLEMHRHFLACLREGRAATSSIEDALETMRLVEQIEQGRGAGMALSSVG